MWRKSVAILPVMVYILNIVVVFKMLYKQIHVFYIVFIFEHNS